MLHLTPNKLFQEFMTIALEHLHIVLAYRLPSELRGVVRAFPEVMGTSQLLWMQAWP
jgi:hypothetical protein